VGQIVLRGAGAGEGPTASAVLADICDIARGLRLPPFGRPADTLAASRRAPAATPRAHYLRMTLRDEPGALARVATVLGDHGISIDRMRQYDHPGADAPVLIVTHPCAPDDLLAALEGVAGTGVVAGEPVALQIQAP
jgi:homoserine dehydrogenase